MNDRAAELIDTPRRDQQALLDALEAAGCDVRKPSAIRCGFHDDKNPSAGIFETDDGAWLFKCHGGDCPAASAFDVWGVRAYNAGKDRAELVAETLRTAREPQRGASPVTNATSSSMHPARSAQRYATLSDLIGSFPHLTNHYAYDVPGEAQPRLVVLRLRRADGGKTYLQAHHDGSGFILGAPAKPWPIYNLAAVQTSEAVVVVEGEKCVESLRTIGIAATTSPAGAGKASHADWSSLRGKRVCVWPDCDDPGKKHGQEILAILREVGAASVRMVNLERLALPPKGDVVDFLAALGDVPRETQRAAVIEVLRHAPSTGASRELAEVIESGISGRRTLVRWPWNAMTALTHALLPGSVAVVAGSPGAAKSFLGLSAMIGIHHAGHRVAALELEETRGYWLQRFLAILASNGNLTDPTWQARNPEATRAAQHAHADDIDALGSALWVMPTATYSAIGDWIESRCAAGARVLLIDPISVADAGAENSWDADRRLMLRAKEACGASGASVIFVSHPKAGPANRMPSLDSIAGGQAIPRLASCVLWVEPKSEDLLPIRTLAHGTAPLRVNRAVRILKARNAKGQGASLGFWFDPDTLEWCEQGVIVDVPRRAAGKSNCARSPRDSRTRSLPDSPRI